MDQLTRSQTAATSPKTCSLQSIQLHQVQLDPEGGSGAGVAELDLGRPQACRREDDNNAGPPVVRDGVSDQHVQQSASPASRLSLSLARFEPPSTRQRYG